MGIGLTPHNNESLEVPIEGRGCRGKALEFRGRKALHGPTSRIASATHILCHPYSYLVSIDNQPHVTRTDHKLAILDLDSLMTHRRR
jgi:hypothetical protein